MDSHRDGVVPISFFFKANDDFELENAVGQADVLREDAKSGKATDATFKCDSVALNLVYSLLNYC